jgi:hypothetical protein
LQALVGGRSAQRSAEDHNDAEWTPPSVPSTFVSDESGRFRSASRKSRQRQLESVCEEEQELEAVEF